VGGRDLTFREKDRVAIFLKEKTTCRKCGAVYGGGIKLENGRCRICREHIEGQEVK